MKKSLENKMLKLEKKFPKMWFKCGEEFSSNHDNSIWTGEGSEINGESAFDYYGYRDTMGVNPKLVAELSKMSLWAEFYDAGTVFIYPN